MSRLLVLIVGVLEGTGLGIVPGEIQPEGEWRRAAVAHGQGSESVAFNLQVRRDRVQACVENRYAGLPILITRGADGSEARDRRAGPQAQPTQSLVQTNQNAIHR